MSEQQDKIPFFVVPCAAGFLVLGALIGIFVAGLLQFDVVPFLFRFAPLFAWGGTFVLALYLGRRPLKEPPPVPKGAGGGFMWYDH